jgi:hypothetical protein
MTWMRKAVAAAMVACTICLIAPAASARGETVLDLLPADTHLVLLVPNIAKAEKQLGVLVEKMKLPQDAKASATLATVLKDFGLNLDQLDKDGSFALVIRKFEEPETLPKEMLILLSVKDYDKFLADNEAAEQTDGTAKMDAKGEVTYVKKVGSFAVLGPDQKVISTFAKPDKSVAGLLTPEHLKLLTSADVSAHVDPKGMVAAMRMAAEMQPQAASAVTLLKALSKQLVSYDLAVRFGADGVEFDAAGLAAEGSDLAKYLAAAESTDKPIISGVSQAGLVLAVGWIASTKVDINPFKDLMPESGGAAVANTDKAQSGSFAMLGTSKEGKLSMPLQFQVVQRFEDEKTARSQAEGQTALGLGGEKGEKTTEKIDGVDVTVAKSAVNLGPLSQLFQIFLGEELVVRQAVKDARLVTMVGGDNKAFGQLLKDATADKPLEDKAGLVGVRKHLHARRAGEMFLSVRPAETLIRAVVAQFTNQPADAAVLPDTVVGASWTCSGRSGDVRIFVPVELLEGLGKLAGEAKPAPVVQPAPPLF